MKELYEKWCKETKRNGSVLVGGSIKEFFDWLKQPEYQEITKKAVESKYRLDTKPSDTAVYVVNIPRFVQQLQSEYIIIKKQLNK